MSRVLRPVLLPVIFPLLAMPRRGGGGSPPAPFIVGDDGSDGGGNWPTSADRALMAPFTVPQTAHLVSFNMRTRDANGSGCRYKGLVYAADGGAGPNGSVLPSTLLAVSEVSAVVGAGVQLITLAISGTVEPQDVWVGYVCDGGGNGETDSGGTNPGQTIMFNGDLSFASPDNPVAEWPGSPGPYANVPAVWLVCN